MSIITIGELRAEHDYDYDCSGTVVVETNGPQGEGADPGAYLRLTFVDRGGTSMNAEVTRDEVGNVTSVAIGFFGDAEIYAAEECLEFALTKLRQYRELVTDQLAPVEQ